MQGNLTRRFSLCFKYNNAGLKGYMNEQIKSVLYWFLILFLVSILQSTLFIDWKGINKNYLDYLDDVGFSHYKFVITVVNNQVSYTLNQYNYSHWQIIQICHNVTMIECVAYLVALQPFPIKISLYVAILTMVAQWSLVRCYIIEF